MRQGSPISGAEGRKVGARLSEAQVAVGATENLFGIVIVLAVVFPRAHRTDFVRGSRCQRAKAATRTTDGKCRDLHSGT